MKMMTDTYAEAVNEACRRVPPLWPLQNFVAVNPFLGLSGRDFSDAIATVERVVHEPMHLGVEFYREQWERGRINADDMALAFERLGRDEDIATALQEAVVGAEDGAVFSVCDLADARTESGFRRLAVAEISKWCAAFYDEGQAAWRLPWADESFFVSWKAMAAVDRSPEIQGLPGFRTLVASLPDDPAEVIGLALEELKVPGAGAELYLHRVLMSVPGWCGYVQYRVRENGMAGREDDSLRQLLAVRMVFELAVWRAEADEEFREVWAERCERLTDPNGVSTLSVWQEAFEVGFQRGLVARIASAPAVAAKEKTVSVQAVFCIDVRSEVFRRSLESVADDVETLGFAGFFGFPIERIGPDDEKATPLCPVLLSPAVRVRESIGGVPADEAERILSKRRTQKRAGRAWKGFKLSAVSSFSFVEACGLGFGGKLLADGFGWQRESPRPERTDLCAEADLEARVAMAAGALTNMGLTSNFAPIVLLCGHGSETANNPYGSSLDCGACGGNAGLTNARIAVRTLNDPEVRDGLRARGIDVPSGTWFVAGLHNTTTDEVSLVEEVGESSEVKVALEKLRNQLAKAGAVARGHRAPSLGLRGGGTRKRIEARSRDWAQVRPEWGLAGNAIFIAAPRVRTAGLDLGGRSFLHNYDWRTDESGAVLELIMMAPMVVANWINLQYYASTVNNVKFGSGNKVLHNVVGMLGVVQGNGGDLQVGLPWQSVHDGRKFVHEPLRLNVMLAAPRERIVDVLRKHAGVGELVANRWLHLFSLEADGGIWRWDGRGDFGADRGFGEYNSNHGWTRMDTDR